MSKVYSISLILNFLVIAVYSQEPEKYKSKWQTRPAIGYYFPVTKLLKGDVTDNLLSYDDQTYYWQIISASYFFHKHWGIEFNFHGASSNNISGRDDKFIQFLHNEYDDKYIVTPSTTASYHNSNVIGGHVERGFLGVIYRMETNRVLFYPKLSIGVTSFYTYWGQAYLKEKNTNNVLEVSYMPVKRPNDHFTLAASSTIGYKLTKRVFFSVDLLSSFYKTKITYSKTMTDRNTGLTTTEEIGYNKYLMNFSMGTGVIIVIK